MNEFIVLKSVLGLMALWFFVYHLWRDYRLDAFRDHVFSVRDRLFLYAAKGNINFNHPAYTILRDRMNVVIRYAHEFTLSRIFLILVTHNYQVRSKAIVRWEEAVEALPNEMTRQKMKEFSVILAVAMLQHMVYRSFFRYIVIRPIMFLVNPFQVREVAERRHVVSSVEALESDALEQDARRIAGKRTHATATA